MGDAIPVQVVLDCVIYMHGVLGKTTAMWYMGGQRVWVQGRTIGLGYRGGQQSWDTGEDNRHGDREGSRHGIQ